MHRLLTPLLAAASRSGVRRAGVVLRPAVTGAARRSVAAGARPFTQLTSQPSTTRRTTHARGFATQQNANSFGRTAAPRNLGLVVVPQQSAYIIERFGRFSKALDAGLHVLLPMIDRIAYVQNLKEEAIPVLNQMAITLDNVTINIDGVLYIKIEDPVKASYGVSNIYYAMVQLAQTTMRSELGKLTLDKTFAGREDLNAAIVESINHASSAWGVRCLRYELKDILPSPGVKQAMDMQAEAERRKRATVLDSEGAKQSEINIAEGARQSAILQAEGEAAAIITKAQATAQGIQVLAAQLRQAGGREAVALQVASQYVEAFGNIAKAGNTMLLPSNPGDAAGMVTQALAIYENIRQKSPAIGATAPAGAASTMQSNEAQQQRQGSAEDQLFMAAEKAIEEQDRDQDRR